MTNIFLSASIPAKDRDKRFYDTADVIAIRDSVKALASVVIPKAKLIWGGHPAITPLIRYVMQRMNTNVKTHVTLYQSEFFKEYFPPDNFYFENIRLTEKTRDKSSSLALMRDLMLKENNFSVGIFIGGMEGVLEEYDLFKTIHPNALILPIGSTGGASKMLFEETSTQPDIRLMNSYAYMALFKDVLKKYIN